MLFPPCFLSAPPGVALPRARALPRQTSRRRRARHASPLRTAETPARQGTPGHPRRPRGHPAPGEACRGRGSGTLSTDPETGVSRTSSSLKGWETTRAGMRFLAQTPRELQAASTHKRNGHPAGDRATGNEQHPNYPHYLIIHSAEPGILGGSRILINLPSAMGSAKLRMTNRCTREPG